MPSKPSVLENLHAVLGLVPVADAFDGTVASDVFNMSQAGRAIATILKGTGATGTSTITVEACDDTTPSNVSAIPFRYRAVTTGDTQGALTEATASGFVTTAGANQMYEIEIDAEALSASGYKYARIKAVESVNDPVVGAILVQLFNLRFAGDQSASAIV